MKNEKIVIIFSHIEDADTKNVLKWLDYFGQRFLLICSVNDLIQNCKIFDIKWIESNVKSVWFRKLNFTFELKRTENLFLSNSLKKFLTSELNSIYDLFNHLYKNTKVLGSTNNMDVEKISTLLIAKKIGLNTPDFLITSNKIKLRDFIKKNGKIITKPIFNVKPIYLSKSKHFYMYSALITNIEEIEDSFFPSLFQAFIEKMYEIRVFFLDGKLFAAGYTNSKRTQLIDSRNLFKTELIYFPVSLPKTIIQKIIRLMEKLNLKTGSLDLILSTEQKYYFLEVNPCGQFERLSNACNFNLDKEVALWLIN